MNEIKITENAIQINKKELFNKLQNSEALENLVNKKFKLLKVFSEQAEFEEDNNIKTVEKLTILTNVGVFHSYSSTFKNALQKAIMVFSDELSNSELLLKKINKNSKSIYVLDIL